MNNKKHVKDFIKHYLDLFPPWNKTHAPTLTPINGLIEPLLVDSFKHIPEKYWYGVPDSPKGPNGLIEVFVFGVSAPKEMASLLFWWADERLRIIPDSAVDEHYCVRYPLELGIDLNRMTIKELAEFIIARIVATTLEGK